ncbi:MAG TPA: histidinol-phosphatase [Gemmatimonadaceae bacterium]|nr:histidinol-phosphatase [Gemmatimonadaceae bacterium]
MRVHEESGALLLEAVSEVARIAGDVALGYYHRGVAVEAKADGSPVTDADRAAERAAREWIERRFPEDGILGEEFGETRAGARRRWVMDPIDGTKTFVRRVPLWGTLIALCEGETVLAGAAYFPAVQEMVAAAPGEGAWWNGARCRVSDVAQLERATILCTDESMHGFVDRHAAWRRLAEEASVTRTWGDCYGYLLVATGRAEVMVDAIMNPWDACALQPVIEEAGGVFTDWRAARTAFGGDTIATNAALARVVRGVLGAGGNHG